MEDQADELKELGVAAVDAGDIEEALLQQVSWHAQLVLGDVCLHRLYLMLLVSSAWTLLPSRAFLQMQQGGAEVAAAAAGEAEPEPAHLEQQLHAVRRELRAVRTVVDGLHQQQQGQPPEEAPQEEGAGAPQQDTLAAGAAAAGGALQQAVMAQRLAGLEAQQRQLEEALVRAGRPPLPPPAPPAQGGPRGASPGPASRPQGRATGAAGLPPKGGKKGRKKRPASELMEVDIFGNGEDDEGHPVEGAALVETERDRLIRLGVLTPFDMLDGFERRVERGPAQRQPGPAEGVEHAAGHICLSSTCRQLAGNISEGE
jgi:DNA excision repair protein ERCC-6